MNSGRPGSLLHGIKADAHHVLDARLQACASLERQNRLEGAQHSRQVRFTWLGHCHSRSLGWHSTLLFCTDHLYTRQRHRTERLDGLTMFHAVRHCRKHWSQSQRCRPPVRAAPSVSPRLAATVRGVRHWREREGPPRGALCSRSAVSLRSGLICFQGFRTWSCTSAPGHRAANALAGRMIHSSGVILTLAAECAGRE